MRSTEDPPIVCRVTPDGEVICDRVSSMSDLPIDSVVRQRAEASITEAFPAGEWGPNKLRLALNILDALGKSTLPDEPNVPRRAGAIVDSVNLLLANQPPSILLYNYSSQPADVVGAYFLNKAELVRMQRLFDAFKSSAPS